MSYPERSFRLPEGVLPPDPPANALDEHVVGGMVEAIKKKVHLPSSLGYEVKEGVIQLVYGLHRREAHIRAGCTEMVCAVMEKAPSPLDYLSLQHAENANRKTFTIIELATLFTRAMSTGGLNGKQVARHFRVSESTVSRALQINARLVDPLKAMVATLALNPRMAYSLSRLDTAEQVPFHNANKALPIDQFEAKIADHLDAKGKPAKKPPVLVELPGIRAVLQHDVSSVLAAAKQLWQACKALADKGGQMSDLPALLRLQGN